MQAVLNKENIVLTVDCFKTMCMMSRNNTGKQVQRYYLDLEKVFKRYMLIEFHNKQLQLKEKTQECKRINNNHNRLLYRRNHYKYKKGSAYYAWYDSNSKVLIIKAGISKKDVNNRLAQERTSVPGMILILILYLPKAKFLEDCMLNKLEKYRIRLNHEFLKLKPENFVKEVKKTLDFMNLKYTEEKTWKNIMTPR